VFRQALDHLGDEAIAAAMNGEVKPVTLHVDSVRKRFEALLRRRIRRC
jgi:hypothetical protein